MTNRVDNCFHEKNIKRGEYKKLYKRSYEKRLLSIFMALALGVAMAAPSFATWVDYKPYGGFGGKVKRYKGYDRVKTSEYTANSLNPHKNLYDVHPLPKGQSAPTVIINKFSFQDGLTAYNLCKKYNARLLLAARPDYVNIGLMRDYYRSKTVYLLGSTKEISASIDPYIERFIPGCKVVRIGNPDPYQRNLDVLRMTGFNDVVVADGRNFADALSASGLCNNKGLGLRIVYGGRGYDPAGLNTVYTVGGSNSVFTDAGKRISGFDRYETGKAVARECSGYSNLLFVNGKDYPDSISAINLVAPKNALVLPIADGRDNSDMKEFLTALPPASFYAKDFEKEGHGIVIGGFGSLSHATTDKMFYLSRGYHN